MAATETDAQGLQDEQLAETRPLLRSAVTRERHAVYRDDSARRRDLSALRARPGGPGPRPAT